MCRSVQTIINDIPKLPISEIVAPSYYQFRHNQHSVGLTVASMADHMSNEGWELFRALQEGREDDKYVLCGNKKISKVAKPYIDYNSTDVKEILHHYDVGKLVIQDRLEWAPDGYGLAKPEEYYRSYEDLAYRNTVFKLTVLKDAHSYQNYHAASACRIGCHAWIVYYHPDIVKAQAPYVRREHLIRTYHTVDPDNVPQYFSHQRRGCLLSGAQHPNHYPLRAAIKNMAEHLPEVECLQHPGYHNRKTNTISYLQHLANYKVAICTSSKHGYALRKIIEATACGCIVITDLPVDEVLPEIDDNLIRIQLEPRHTLQQRLTSLLLELYNTYSPEKQQYFSLVAKSYYSITNQGKLLVQAIDDLAKNY